MQRFELPSDSYQAERCEFRGEREGGAGWNWEMMAQDHGLVEGFKWFMDDGDGVRRH